MNPVDNGRDKGNKEHVFEAFFASYLIARHYFFLPPIKENVELSMASDFIIRAGLIIFEPQ
jgi:hypothetical protein